LQSLSSRTIGLTVRCRIPRQPRRVRKVSEFHDLARRCRGFDPNHPSSCITLIRLNLALHLCDFDRRLGPILRPSCAQLFQFGPDIGHRIEPRRKLTERQAERRERSASCGNRSHCHGAD